MPIPVLQYFLKKKQECTVISSFADRPCSWSLHFNAPNVLNSSFIFSKPPQLLTVNKQSSVVLLTHSAHLGQSEVRTAALPQRWSSTPCRSSASSSSSIFPSSAALPRPPPRFLPRLPLPPLLSLRPLKWLVESSSGLLRETSFPHAGLRGLCEVNSH